MRAVWLRLLLGAGLLALHGYAIAAAVFSCSLGAPPNYSQTYSSAGNSSTPLSVVVTCTKTGSGSGLTINYTVTPNNGLNASGTQNRAVRSGNFVNYDLYTATNCSVPWSGSGSIVFGTGGGSTISQTLNYFGCVPASQPTPPPAGTSNDTVSMTLAISTGGVSITGPNPRTFLAAVTVNPACSVTTGPGTVVAFGSYVAFGSQKTATTSFGVTCTLTTPYTLSFAAPDGVVSGLRYSLLLNTVPSGGSHPLGPVNGTGASQTYHIIGTMPANQAGTCTGASCANTNTHTVTLTY